MKAADLNGTHIGRLVIVTDGGNSITGELSRVNHQGTVITVNPWMEPPREVLGRLWVTLEFLGGFTANVTPAAEVQLPIWKPEATDPKESPHGG
jgi:hypothetical protein